MQEALQNSSAHAQAQNATVMLAFSPKTVKLTIIDDGCGFDLQAAADNSAEHLGLLGMQERAESLGGHLTIYTKFGEGTRVELVVPV
jgi:signal transduction histidine kinase